MYKKRRPFSQQPVQTKLFWAPYLLKYLTIRIQKGFVSDKEKSNILKDLRIKAPMKKWTCYFLSQVTEHYYYRIQTVCEHFDFASKEKPMAAWVLVMKALLDFSFNYTVKVAKTMKLFPDTPIEQIMGVLGKLDAQYRFVKKRGTEEKVLARRAWTYSTNQFLISLLLKQYPPTFLPTVLQVVSIDDIREFKEMFLDKKPYKKDLEPTTEFEKKYQSRTVRVNLLHTSREKMLVAFQKEGVEAEISRINPWGITITGACDLPKMQEFQDGLFSIQDFASQMATQYIDPMPTMKVLDFCAGFGSKTLGFSVCMKNKGNVVATDIHDYKIEELKLRARRAQSFNIETVTKTKVMEELDRNSFDMVVVDAPCTGSGTLVKNPEIKTQLTSKSISELTEKQLTILNEAAEFVQANGTLVYSTCSVLRSEDEAIVEQFIKEHPEFEVYVPEKKKDNFSPFIHDDKYFSTRKQLSQMEGAFVAMMRKKG